MGPNREQGQAREAISREEALYIARLARLRLTPAELERFTPQLNDILAHVERLATADVEQEQADPAGAGEAPLAEDQPGPDAPAFGPDAFAPSFEEGFFSLPRLGALDADAQAEE